MKYIAIEMLGKNEMNGVVMQMEGCTKESLESDDPSALTRFLYNYLLRNGWTPDRDGVISVIAFGVVRMQLLTGMITLGRYVNFIGGIHNPRILTGAVDKIDQPMKVEQIIEVVNRYLNTKRKKNVFQKAQ